MESREAREIDILMFLKDWFFYHNQDSYVNTVAIAKIHWLCIFYYLFIHSFLNCVLIKNCDLDFLLGSKAIGNVL